MIKTFLFISAGILAGMLCLLIGAAIGIWAGPELMIGVIVSGICWCGIAVWLRAAAIRQRRFLARLERCDCAACARRAERMDCDAARN